VAAMDLALLKLRRGLRYGLPGPNEADSTFGDLFGALGRVGWRCSAIDCATQVRTIDICLSLDVDI